MSISFIRVEAPGEKWTEDRSESEIIPTLPVVLGRGSLLRCGDKKISRRHAYLDWEDDGVMLTAAHPSHTYVLAKGVERELEQGDSQLLYHGDKFGLTKDNFWYQVNLPSTDDEKDNSATKSKVAKDQVEPSKDEQPSVSNKKGSLKQDPSVSAEETSTKINGMKDSDTDIPVHNGLEETTLGDTDTKPKGKTTTNTFLTVSAADLQNAVSVKKRNLPEWLTKIDASKSSKPPEKETKAPISHGGSRKPKATSVKRKSSKGLLYVSDEDVPGTPKAKPRKSNDCGDSTPRKRKATDTSKKENVSPSPKKRATPAKKKGSPIKNNSAGLHAMSEESDQDIGDEVNKVLTQTPKKKKPSPKKQTSPSTHALSDEDSDDGADKVLTQTPKSKVKAQGATTPSKKKKKPSPKKHTSPSTHVMSDDADSESDGEDGAGPDEAAVNEDSASEEAKATSRTTKKKPRQTCRFGANCYRKNPQHLADFAHMGDSDFHGESSDDENDDDDDRPECEYGIDCYRRNRQHRRDYKHSRFPQPQRRAKRKARQQKNKDDSGSDDYDYDDPFLYDGSSDDYAPTDSGSDSSFAPGDGDDEEDTRRMLNEGKKFVKKR